MSNENIVSIMIQQHKNIYTAADEVSSLSEVGENNIPLIFDKLLVFKNLLEEHLKLENEVFYVELLKNMEDRNLDTTATVLFIDSMKSIGEDIGRFLEKYNSTDNIQGSLDNFISEFNDIINILKVRTESEEEGVYGYWSFFR